MDDEGYQTPPYLGYFDVSNSGFAWRDPIPQQIERRRADLGDVLIFDILLSSGGIREPDTVFPPSDVESLVRLLDAIESSQYDALKKDCLVYFLLKWHQDGRENRFQVERCIPPQFGSLADAYWHLDTGINIPRAVAILADARLNRDYASRIIYAISLAPDSAPLIVRYIRTAKPLLTEPDDLDIYTLALAESSLREAWLFQRTFNETDLTRSRLLKKTLEWCLSPEPRSRPLTELLGLPLSKFEETLIHEYALKPPSTTPIVSIAVLRDLVCVRLIQAGNYAEAIKMDHRFSSSTLNESKTPVQDRKKMVQDLYAALPLAERSLLDADLELPTNGTPKAPNTVKKTPTNPSTNGGDVSMSQSWEDVPRPSPRQPQNGITNGRVQSTASPFRDILSQAPVPSRLGGATLGNANPAPIIPISSPGINGKKPTPKNGLPLSSNLFASSSSRPRKSLTQTAGQLFLGNSSTSSPANGLGLSQPNSQPLGASTSSGVGFSSASRKPNAFYQPPSATNTNNGSKRTFEGDVVTTRQNGHPPSPVKDNGLDIDMDAEHSENDAHMGSPTRQHDEDAENQDEGVGLGFSVFGNGPQVERQRERRQEAPVEDASRITTGSTRAKTPEKPVRHAPPGAFQHSDEEDGGAEEHEEPQPITPPPQRSRTSRSSKVTPAAKPTTRPKRVKDKDLGRSLPGSLMDEEEEEEEDHVAPLKAPSPSRRPLRKVRSSATADLSQDDTGMQTRRRSSRLSTAGSTHGGSPEPPSPKKTTTKTRKKAASGTKRR